MVSKSCFFHQLRRLGLRPSVSSCSRCQHFLDAFMKTASRIIGQTLENHTACGVKVFDKIKVAFSGLGAYAVHPPGIFVFVVHHNSLLGAFNSQLNIFQNFLFFFFSTHICAVIGFIEELSPKCALSGNSFFVLRAGKGIAVSAVARTPCTANVLSRKASGKLPIGIVLFHPIAEEK